MLKEGTDNMLTILMNTLLLCLILLLAYPKPLHVTIKKTAPVLAVIGVIFCAVIIIQTNGQRRITVTALDQRNDAAEGSELLITGVSVDGTDYSAADFFSEGWINEGGRLRWRSYDQPSGMHNSVSAEVPALAKVDILFETNKWRGCAQVQEGKYFSLVYQVDCYSDSDEGGHALNYFSVRKLSGIRVSGKAMFLCLLGILAVLAIGFGIFYRDSKPGGSQRTGRKREVWLDVLKMFSAPLIVLIHTVGGPYSNTPVDSTKWLGYLLINTVPRCAVPIFIMVSGILLIGRGQAAKVRRNVKKALILLVVWNLVYIFAQALLWGSSESILSQILSLPVKRGPSGHLWYAHLLVWIYLFAPIISSLYQALTNRMRIYFVLLTVVIPGILDMYTKIFGITTSPALYAFQLHMTLTYIGIMFAGRLIYENAAQVKRVGLISLLAAVFGLGGMLAVTYYYAAAHHTATEKFLAETQLLAVCYAGGLVGIAAKYREALEHLPEILRKAVEWLSRHSLGIYFFHMLPIWTIGSIQLLGGSLSVYDGFIETLALCVFYYVLTVIGVGLMGRIPFLKNLVT